MKKFLLFYFTFLCFLNALGVYKLQGIYLISPSNKQTSLLGVNLKKGKSYRLHFNHSHNSWNLAFFDNPDEPLAFGEYQCRLQNEVQQILFFRDDENFIFDFNFQKPYFIFYEKPIQSLVYYKKIIFTLIPYFQKNSRVCFDSVTKQVLNINFVNHRGVWITTQKFPIFYCLLKRECSSMSSADSTIPFKNKKRNPQFYFKIFSNFNRFFDPCFVKKEDITFFLENTDKEDCMREIQESYYHLLNMHDSDEGTDVFENREMIRNYLCESNLKNYFLNYDCSDEYESFIKYLNDTITGIENSKDSYKETVTNNPFNLCTREREMLDSSLTSKLTNLLSHNFWSIQFSKVHEDRDPKNNYQNGEWLKSVLDPIDLSKEILDSWKKEQINLKKLLEFSWSASIKNETFLIKSKAISFLSPSCDTTVFAGWHGWVQFDFFINSTYVESITALAKLESNSEIELIHLMWCYKNTFVGQELISISNNALRFSLDKNSYWFLHGFFSAFFKTPISKDRFYYRPYLFNLIYQKQL